VKDDLMMISRDVERVDHENINEVAAGLYVADMKSQIRLSLEGTQILGPKAIRNVIDLDDEERDGELQDCDAAAQDPEIGQPQRECAP
jgi:hypothetical protein